MDNAMHVFCAINNEYAMPLSVMLQSMKQSLTVTNPVVAHVAFSDLSPAAQRKVEQTIEGSQIRINWIAAADLPLNSAKLWGHVSRESYYRIFVGSLLPSSIDKIIYLDADLVILSCISLLWSQQFGHATVLAARDVSEFSGLVSSTMGVNNYEKLGIPPTAVYFNAGVMVIDLDQWRRTNVQQHSLAYMEEYIDDINYWDQDVLNAVLWDAWRELDYRWNVAAGAISDYDVLLVRPFEEQQFRVMVKEAFIYHFSTERKPWHRTYSLPRRELFIDAFLMTPWAVDPHYQYLK